jgi:hypothetical protein
MPGERRLLMKWLFRTAVLLALLAAGLPAQASDPVGTYTLIDRVVLEPTADAPERVQLWGVFAQADGKPGDRYLPARRGYLFYTIDPGKREVCRREWADFRTIAGTGQAVGFGGRYLPKGRIRKATEKPEAPDPYPVGWGLVKVLSRHLGRQIERDLRSVPPEK